MWKLYFSHDCIYLTANIHLWAMWLSTHLAKNSHWYVLGYTVQSNAWSVVFTVHKDLCFLMVIFKAVPPVISWKKCSLKEFCSPSSGLKLQCKKDTHFYIFLNFVLIIGYLNYSNKVEGVESAVRAQAGW